MNRNGVFCRYVIAQDNHYLMQQQFYQVPLE